MKNKNDKSTMDWCESLFGLEYKHEEIVKHGTVKGYKKHKCRCDACTQAKHVSDEKAKLRQLIKLSTQEVMA